MTNVNIKKSRMTVKAEFKEAKDRKENKIIDSLDRKKSRERPNTASESTIRTYRGVQYKKDYGNE